MWSLTLDKALFLGKIMSPLLLFLPLTRVPVVRSKSGSCRIIIYSMCFIRMKTDAEIQREALHQREVHLRKAAVSRL